MSPRRGIPTSRAYWELKADQLLNRVFDPVPALEVELCDTPSDDVPATPLTFTRAQAAVATAAPVGMTAAVSAPPPAVEVAPPPPAPPAPVAAAAAPPAAVPVPPVAASSAPPPPPAPAPPRAAAAVPRRPAVAATTRIPWHRHLGDWVSERPGLALASFAGTCVLMGGSSLVFLGYWNATQQALRQERNLLLVERLRALGPAASAPAPEGAAQTPAQPGEGVSASLPPPPPEEPWMEELADLPSGGAPAPAPLKVPVSSSIAQPAPPSSGGGGGGGGSAPVEVAAASGGGGGEAPQLVGVVQVPGRGGSAIFQIGGTSTTAGVGESIGGSGWRLRSANGDTAVIERGGQQRRISISSGF
ncbi:MAG: hypothetical protein VKJ66_06990 [Synechococcus sp.]|nr:hypothetical protein [Synechococcus sp.]